MSYEPLSWCGTHYGGLDDLPQDAPDNAVARCGKRSVDGNLYVWIRSEGKWDEEPVLMSTNADTPRSDAAHDMVRLIDAVHAPLARLSAISTANTSGDRLWRKRADETMELIRHLRIKYDHCQ